MAIAAPYNSKTIDELIETGKLTGNEKFIISINAETDRKVSVDTLVGYAASKLSGSTMTVGIGGTGNGQCIMFIEEGKEIPINERTPGCFYLEEEHQSSLRTKINIPTSVKVSSSLGLRRV